MPNTILIAYASTHGHTTKIAERIAARLHDVGVKARVCDLGKGAGRELADPARADGVILAASVHRGAHQEDVHQWVREHHDTLADRPSIFLSVSLSAAEDTDEARAATQGLIDAFEDAAGWIPDRTVSVAGALQYREYDVFTRTLVRLLMKRGGHPTDTSHDYDYTDWDAIDALATEFAALVSGTGAPA